MMEELVKKILDTSVIDAGVRGATSFSIDLGAILAPVFFLLNATWNFAITTIRNLGERPKFFDKMDLIRAAILWFILSFGYNPIFGTVARLGESLGRISGSTVRTYQAGKEVFANNLEQQFEDQPKPADEQPETGESANDNSLWELITGSVNVMIFQLFSSGTLAITSVVRIGVIALSIMLAKILYAIGPIVIAFSILPVFKEKLSTWFGIYVCCLCVPFTCNLLDAIYYSLMGAGLSGKAIVNPLTLSVFNIVYIITYCLVFWITSLYAGSSGAGKFLSTAIAGATTVIGMTSGTLKPGASGNDAIADQPQKNQRP